LREKIMAADHADISKHVRLYISIFVVLGALTVVTVLASYVHLGAKESHVGNMLLGMFIALIKASLVAAIFMHLKWERKIIYWTLVLCFLKFTLLMVLPLLTIGDSMHWKG
jgi:caa(3)-type oxidase subunit IV